MSIPARHDTAPAGRAARGTLRAARGGTVVLVRSGTPGAGRTPMCLTDDAYPADPGDVLFGEVETFSHRWEEP